MQPHRHIERRPTRLAWHEPPDQEPSSRLSNAYARTPMAEQRIANPYDNGYRIHPEAMPEVERHRMREQHAASLLEPERLEPHERHILENPRRGAISFGSAGMAPSARPTFPPSQFAPGNPAAVLQMQRNRMRRAAISSGSSVMPPPPIPSYPSPGNATVNPAAVSGAAEPSISGRNRLRSPEHPWGPPPPPRSPEFSSFDGASSQGTADLDNDEYPTRPATFQEALDRDRSGRIRSRNSEPFTRGSGSYRTSWSPGPPNALASEFRVSNERPSRGTAEPTPSSFSAAVQEAVDYNNNLAARGADSQQRHASLLPATERASPLSARDRQLEIMNRAVQPRNRAQPTSEMHASLTSAARRANDFGARISEITRQHQDANVAHPNHEADIMARSNTRRRTIPTAYEFLNYDMYTRPSAEQRVSNLHVSNEKIDSFVHGLPVHVIIDLPAEEQKCAICMEKYYGPHQRECPVRLPCNHVFGKACLLTWFKSPATNRKNNCCPICRAVVLERVPIFPHMDDFLDDPSSDHDISDHHGGGFTARSTGLREESQNLWNLEREALAMERDIERNIERNERERNVTGWDQEHENLYREREADHQRELARIRREHAERIEMLQHARGEMRGERMRRRTEG